MVVQRTTKDRDLIPVVVYYRCSSPQQELSVDEQRKDVEAYCARKGYRIVRAYVDEGKSASKEPEKRVAFNQMIANAHAQDFRVVVTYDASRFSRFDNIEGSTPKQILRSNGIILDTTKEGEFDWRTPEGRWKDMAYCESNKALSLNISKDSNRGRLHYMALGFWPNGVVPYGYDKEYTNGTETLFRRRHERYRKPRDWHLRLVVNEAEAEVVRLCFDLFVNKLWSRRQIATHLTGRGVPPPLGQHGKSNGCWDGYSVLTILTEKAYVGIATVGSGRHSRAAHNRMEKAEQPSRACPALVDPHVWHEAQEQIERRREDKAKPQPGRAGILSGFVKCGHCGYRLSKAAPARYGGGVVYYSCTSTTRRPHLGCKSYRVGEEDLMPKVTAWLVASVDAELLDTLQASPADEEGHSAEEAILAGHVKALEAKVKGATESALLAPPSAREAAWAMVSKWQEELEQAKQKLSLLQGLRHAPELAGFKEWWTQARTSLLDWSKVNPGEVVAEFCPGARLDSYDPEGLIEAEKRDRLRALLARLGFEAKVWWELNTHRGQREAKHFVKDVQIKASVDLAAGPFMPGSSAGTRHKVIEVRRVFSLNNPPLPF